MDRSGSVYVAGGTISSDFPTLNPFQSTLETSDAFVSKLTNNLDGLVYSTYLGGSDGERAEDIVVDEEAEAYVTGSTGSHDFPLVNAYQELFPGGTLSGFISKLVQPEPPPMIEFSTAVDYSAGNAPQAVIAADMDGDSSHDLVLANFSSDNISLLKNTGDGTFVAAVNYAAGDGPRSLCAADLDGDADKDLIVANSSSSNVSVLKNNGDGTFTTSWCRRSESNRHDVAIGGF